MADETYEIAQMDTRLKGDDCAIERFKLANYNYCVQKSLHKIIRWMWKIGLIR